MHKQLSSPLFLTLITLMGVGLVQVYSSSYILATENFNDGLFFFKKQGLFVVLAFFTMLLVSQIPYVWIRKWSWVLWGLATLGVLLTLVPGLGVRVGGATRWLQLPMGFRFEPGELLKFSFPLLFASYLAKSETPLRKINNIYLLVLVALPLVLLLKQPDFGSFVIISSVGFALLFAFGLRWRYILAGAAVAIPAFYFLVMQVGYRRARVMAFLDPWSDPEAKGFQAIQSMLSYHSGGISGVGLGQGQGKLFFLPEAHTDFTMAVLGEEMGFIGFLIVLALYGFVVLRGFQLATRSQEQFAKAMALGITMVFGLSVFINAGVTLGLLPTKGLTMPFMSYGGSSLLTLSMAMGLLLNLERQQNDRENGFHRRGKSIRLSP